MDQTIRQSDRLDRHDFSIQSFSLTGQSFVLYEIIHSWAPLLSLSLSLSPGNRIWIPAINLRSRGRFYFLIWFGVMEEGQDRPRRRSMQWKQAGYFSLCWERESGSCWFLFFVFHFWVCNRGSKDVQKLKAAAVAGMQTLICTTTLSFFSEWSSFQQESGHAHDLNSQTVVNDKSYVWNKRKTVDPFKPILCDPPLRSIVDMMVTEVPPSIRFYHGKYIIAKLFQNTILFKACNGLPVILLSAGKLILILCNATIYRNEGK